MEAAVTEKKTEDVPSAVRDEEIEWMMTRRVSRSDEMSIDEWKLRLTLDCGESEAIQIIKAFDSAEYKKFLPALGWHGVSSRWQQFLSWLQGQTKEGKVPKDAESAFKGFANHLGRVTAYRALAISPEQFEVIKTKDTIWPTGRLKTEAKVLENIINEKGAKFVFYARLYIGLQLLKYDPSLSLHDDPETAVCIAGGYVSNEKQIHLMEMSVPKILASGFKLCEIQDASNKEKWFEHRAIWFDAEDETTERYVLHEIPFFKKNCKSVRIFKTNQEIKQFLLPFQQKQLEKKRKSENQQ